MPRSMPAVERRRSSASTRVIRIAAHLPRAKRIDRTSFAIEVANASGRAAASSVRLASVVTGPTRQRAGLVRRPSAPGRSAQFHGRADLPWPSRSTCRADGRPGARAAISRMSSSSLATACDRRSDGDHVSGRTSGPIGRAIRRDVLNDGAAIDRQASSDCCEVGVDVAQPDADVAAGHVARERATAAGLAARR